VPEGTFLTFYAVWEAPPLNKIPRAVVLLPYPKDAFGNTEALRVFRCSDLSMNDETILEYYSHCWRIKVIFRSQKR